MVNAMQLHFVLIAVLYTNFKLLAIRSKLYKPSSFAFVGI